MRQDHKQFSEHNTANELQIFSIQDSEKAQKEGVKPQ